MVDYAELRTKSAFSFLDGASAPEELVETAEQLGYRALALLDRDGLYGAPRFYKEAKSRKLRAIVGADLLIVDSFDEFRAAIKKARSPEAVPGTRIGILVPDRPSYKALCQLLTLAKMRLSKPQAAEFGAPLTWDELAARRQGLLALAPPTMHQDSRQRLIEVFGRQNVYFEVQRHLQRGDERRIREVQGAAKRLGVEAVATNDVRYHVPRRAPLHDVLTCLRHKTTLEAAGDLLTLHTEKYLKAPGEMARLFADLPEAVRETLAVAERCAFTLEDLGYRFPDYPLPPGVTPVAKLRELVDEGLPRRFPDSAPRKVIDQIAHELALIEKLGLAGYFLILREIIDFCEAQDIMVQGRGSAANSAVCYVLRITNVNPLEHELLFERFLSETRGEWPDIDLDLPSGDLREKVIQHVYERYGRSGAAMTANVITYRTRSAMRDVGKVLGFPPEVLDRVSGVFGHWQSDEPGEVRKRLEEVGLDVDHPRTGHLLTLVEQIRHLPRHLGQHSGGMVVCQGLLDDVAPLEPATMENRTIITWDKDDCADLGILKIDLLGLGMMGVLQDARKLINGYVASREEQIDYARLPKSDPAIWEILCKADTVGLFQVESRAQMATLPRMQPRCFYDLVVSIGLIRPGPITGQMVNPYLQRRAGRQAVTYPHPDLEPVLERTKGIPIFQEQILKMAMIMADFTGAQAERVRRAMAFKRSREAMGSVEQELRAGMARRGHPAATIDEVVNHITSFAEYGFPEAHSISFALLAYATAYLKVHHPAAFLACLLNNWPMGFYHPRTLIQDAQRHGVEVRPIDVTRSDWQCTLEPAGPWAVRVGLRYVEGVRKAALEVLPELRPFADLRDFMTRVSLRGDEIERLATIGALSSLSGLGRREALWQVQGLADYRTGLLAGADPEEDEFELVEMNPVEELAADLQGMALTTAGHPMAFERDRLRKQGIQSATDLPAVPSGRWVTVAGVVVVRNHPPTAKGMVFLSLEDEGGFINIVLDPQHFARYRAEVVSSPALIVDGRLERKDGVTNIRAERVRPLQIWVHRAFSRDFH